MKLMKRQFNWIELNWENVKQWYQYICKAVQTLNGTFLARWRSSCTFRHVKSGETAEVDEGREAFRSGGEIARVQTSSWGPLVAAVCLFSLFDRGIKLVTTMYREKIIKHSERPELEPLLILDRVALTGYILWDFWNKVLLTGHKHQIPSSENVYSISMCFESILVCLRGWS